MELIRRELAKVEKSRSGSLLKAIVLLIVVVYSIVLIQFNRITITNGLDFIIGINNNINMFGIIMLIGIYYTSVLFAKDYEDRTYLYASIRRTDINKIYLARVMAVFLYLVKIYIYMNVLLFIFSFFKWGFTPLEMCEGINESIGRVVLLIIEICIGNLFWMSITVFAAVICQNQIISIIIGIFFNTVFNLLVQSLPEAVHKFIIGPYNNFYRNGLFTVESMGEFLTNIALAFANYLIYAAIIYGMSLWVVHMRERRS